MPGQQSVHRTFSSYFLSLNHCKLRFILSTRTTFNQLQQAVQYTYSLYKAKRDSTPNEQYPLLGTFLCNISQDVYYKTVANSTIFFTETTLGYAKFYMYNCTWN